MAETLPRYFTPEEANALLPRIVEQLAQVAEVVRRARSLAHTHEAAESSVAAIKARLGELQNDAERLLDDIQAAGVHVKGVEPALLDFPALRQGQEVFLCWREGEDEVTHWHPLHTGYKGRKSLDHGDLGIWEWCN